MDGLTVVVGGSGFVGRYVVQALARSGSRIRVTTRNPQAALFLRPLAGLGDMQIVGADVRDPAALARAFDGATAGVNLAGILAEKGVQRFDAVQAQGAANVAQAAAAAGVSAFVQVSAIGADAASPATYAQTKAAGEAAVLAALPQATILRPSIIFGREDQFINRFAGLMQQLPVVPVVAGGTKFQPVYVLDVAEAVVAALGDPVAHGGRTYELGGPTTYAFRDILRWIRDQVRPGKRLLAVPDAAAALMARAGDYLPFAPMTYGQWLMLQSDNVVTAGVPGLAELGIPATPLEAIAPAYLERFKTGGRFHRDPLVA